MNEYELAIIEVLRRRNYISKTREVKRLIWEEGYAGGCDTCGYGATEPGMEVQYADNGYPTKVRFNYSFSPADLVKEAVEVLND